VTTRQAGVRSRAEALVFHDQRELARSVPVPEKLILVRARGSHARPSTVDGRRRGSSSRGARAAP